MLARSWHRPLTAACAFVLLIVLSAPAQAQSLSNTTGVYLNAHLSGTSITYDFDNAGEETNSGGGLGVQIGYGFSPLVTLFLGANGSGMETEDGDSYALSHVDVGVRFNFGAGRRQLVPYADLAATFRQATFEFENGTEIDVSGGGGTLGGGLAYFLSPTIALDLGLQLTFGTFSDVSVGGIDINNQIDISAGSGRLALGLTWYPTRR